MSPDGELLARSPRTARWCCSTSERRDPSDGSKGIQLMYAVLPFIPGHLAGNGRRRQADHPLVAAYGRCVRQATPGLGSSRKGLFRGRQPRRPMLATGGTDNDMSLWRPRPGNCSPFKGHKGRLRGRWARVQSLRTTSRQRLLRSHGPGLGREDRRKPTDRQRNKQRAPGVVFASNDSQIATMSGAGDDVRYCWDPEIRSPRSSIRRATRTGSSASATSSGGAPPDPATVAGQEWLGLFWSRRASIGPSGSGTWTRASL